VGLFKTGLYTVVRGYTARGAEMRYSPDGKVIAEIRLGVGGGNERYPVMWVNVALWESDAEEVLKVLDKKGMAVEASGLLLVKKFSGGRDGSGVSIDLKNVGELKIFDRNGELIKEISGERGIKKEVGMK
jgi:single-stranded DNA-binding protein